MPLLSVVRALSLGLIVSFCTSAFADQLDNEKARAKQVLKIVVGDIEKNYYDPTFHGIDLDLRFKQAEEKIKQSTSNGQIFSTIAQVALEFKDSHLYFLPPGRANRTDYGWQMQMIGNRLVQPRHLAFSALSANITKAQQQTRIDRLSGRAE